MLEAADYKESNEEDYRRMMADEEVMMTMIFLTAPPPFQYQNEKNAMEQTRFALP